MQKTAAIFLTLLISWLSLAAGAWAQEIAIVESARIAPYQEAVSGFQARIIKAGSFRGAKSIQPHQTTVFHLDTADDRAEFTRNLDKLQPELLVAVGDKALAALRDSRLPIIYLMVSDAYGLAQGRRNITGIEMIIDPALQFEAIRRQLPKTRKLGVIYSPAKTGPLLEAAKAAAQDSELRLFAMAADSPKEVKLALDSLEGQVDALWLSPDSTVLTPATLKLFSLFSLKQQIPLIAFSAKYLRHGAALAIYAKPFDLGAQAAQLALRLLAGESPAQAGPEYGATVTTLPNRQIIDKLGLPSVETDPDHEEYRQP